MFVNTCTKGLEFYNIISELTCGDLVSENCQHLHQLSLFNKADLQGTFLIFGYPLLVFLLAFACLQSSHEVCSCATNGILAAASF